MAGDERVAGRYRLLRRLGAGAYGEAHLAEDAGSGLHVVVKLLHARLMREGTPPVERFRREVKALERLEHPHITRLLDHGTCAQRGQPWYAVAWSPGLPLDHVLESRGPLAPGLALRLVDQLLSALGEAARRSIVHRDLKPGNLLVENLGDGDERLLVLDFGLAKHLADETEEELTGKRPIGTPAFMAPEQCRGEAVSSATDLYAVGCLLFALLTGRPPFEGETGAVLLAHHCFEPPPRLDAVFPGAPREGVDLAAALLAKAPGDRPTIPAARALVAKAARARWPARAPARAPGPAGEVTLPPDYGGGPPTGGRSEGARRPGPRRG